jgi:multiple sugar transport system substrate-binding protein
LHINATQFTDAGFSTDALPTEISQLDQMAEALTVTDDAGNLTQLGFLPWFGTQIFHWGWAFGGDFYDAENDKITCGTDEKIIEALTWYQSYAQKYDIEKIDRFRSGFGRETMSPDDPWYVGKLSMAIQGSFKRSWIPRYAPELDYLVTASPTVPGVPPVSEVAIGAMFNVPKGANNPEGGWKLAQEMASKRCQIEFNKAVGNLPPLIEAANDPEYLDALPFAEVFIQTAAEGGRSYPAMPSLELYRSELIRAVDEVLHGLVEPEAALMDVEAKVQKDLDDFRKQVAA